MRGTSFIRFYRWGMEMKYHMGLYFSGLVFMKAISDGVCGEFSMETLHLIQMLLVCMAFAIAESWLFPSGEEQEQLRRNTIWWTVLAHVAFVGGAAIMGWFSPAPWWMLLILLVVFELSLGAMWFGFHVALKQDSRQLNKQLRAFQKQ